MLGMLSNKAKTKTETKLHLKIGLSFTMSLYVKSVWYERRYHFIKNSITITITNIPFSPL